MDPPRKEYAKVIYDGVDITDELNPLLAIPQAIGGGVVEAITQGCTAVMATRLQSLGIPAKVVFRNQGSHSWGLFEAEMQDSWAVIGPAIGA